ncbi:IS4 family transposase, partial [Methylocaldum sp.]|uniref:IS4 family transposase n=1 Tax=Methylocaldum sp. TaxID=1969727 RepID=UPI002D35219A
MSHSGVAVMDHAVTLLKAALAEHLAWHGARLTFLAQFLLTLFKVKSVNLAELAQGFAGPAHVASHYQRLQRFFRSFKIDYDILARLLVRLFPVGEGPWYVTLDRTPWKFGKTDLNVLILRIAHQGIALPVLWTVLDKPCHSDTEERMALMQRFLSVFGASSIRALLADREFVGEDWLPWLQAPAIPFYLRLKRNTLIPNAWAVPRRAEVLVQSLKPGRTCYLAGRRPVWGCFVHLSALRLTDGDFLIVASSTAPQHEA